MLALSLNRDGVNMGCNLKPDNIALNKARCTEHHFWNQKHHKYKPTES